MPTRFAAWVRSHWQGVAVLLVPLAAVIVWAPAFFSSEEGNRWVDSLLKVAGGVVAAWWFIRRDRHKVRLRLSQEVSADRFDGAVEVSHAIHVSLLAENIGDVPFRGNECSVVIFGVDPLIRDVEVDLRGGEGDTVKTVESDDRLPYHRLAERKLSVVDFHLRPGEAEALTFTATIQSPVKLAGHTDLVARSILVRSQLSRDDGLAWTARTFLDLP